MSVDPQSDASDLEQLFSLSVDLMCIANFEGYFLRINPSFTRVLGHSDDELRAHPFLDFVHPDDRDATIAEMSTLAAGATTIDFENRYRCADGTYRWLDWHARPVTNQQKIFAVARDVTQARAHATALKDREAELRAVIEGTVDALVTIDTSGTIESCNAAFVSMFGYDPGSAIGQPVSMLMPEPYRSKHASYLTRYLTTGEAKIIGRGQREVIGVRADGTTFPMELGVSEILLSSRRIFLGILRDISERKRGDERHAALLEREARERSRVEFASGIVHDLGNVLTAVSACVAEVRSSLQHAERSNELPRTARFVRSQFDALAVGLGKPKAEALVEILEGVERARTAAQAEILEGLNKLATSVEHANDLLEAHRHQSDSGQGGRSRMTSVANVVRTVQAMISDGLVARGGTLDVQVTSNARNVRVDSVLLVRALVNGGRNALDAFDGAPRAEAPRVTIRADVDSESVLRLVLSDNGPGFEGAGERFFQDGSTTRARGSGLGLGAARRAIASLGGTLTLTSDGPGRGAEFCISLPLSDEAL